MPVCLGKIRENVSYTEEKDNFFPKVNTECHQNCSEAFFLYNVSGTLRCHNLVALSLFTFTNISNFLENV